MKSRDLAETFIPAQAQWSPNGRKVAYSNADRKIVVMNADGSSKTQLTHGKDSYDTFPVWSPDGTRIAFQRGADSCGVKVIAKSLDGSSRVVVTDNSSGAEGAEPPKWPVSWSADGSRISYERYDFCTDEGPPWESDIYSANTLTGSDETKISDNALKPLWSPAHNRVAYTTIDGLVVSKPDGSQRTVVAAETSPFFYEWSPDGRRIVYSTGEMFGFTCGSAHVVRRNGSNRTRVTPKRLCTADVSWAPRGRTLVFVARARAAGGNSNDWDVYRIRTDRSRPKRLTFARGTTWEVDW